MKTPIDENIKNLFREQRFAVIATQGKNEPYTNLVSFLAGKDFKKIYFPTSKKSKKYENISKYPGISMLVDNRDNKPEDIKNAIAVNVFGKSKETKNKEIIDNFLIKHPYLKDFINSPDCTMIQIDVEKCIAVDNFQNVKIFK